MHETVIVSLNGLSVSDFMLHYYLQSILSHCQQSVNIITMTSTVSK